MKYPENQQGSFWKIILYISLSVPAGIILLIILGTGTNFFIALPGLLGLVTQPPLSERTAFSVPGQYAVELTRAGEYMIISDAVNDIQRAFPLQVFETQLYDSAGKELALEEDGLISWDTEDLEGTLLYEFKIDTPGTYIIIVDSDRQDDWTVLPNYSGSNQLILITFYLLIIGVIIAGWQIRERRLDRHRKASAQQKGQKFDEWLDNV